MRCVVRTAWVGLALSMLAACSQAPAPVGSDGQVKDTLTVALEGDFPSLDPLRVSNMAERQVALAVMDPLFDLGPEGELVPVLAQGHEALEEGRIWRITLREGVKFQDGTLLDSLVAVRAVDARTVEFEMDGPNAVLPALLADSPGLMLSPTAVKAAPEAVATRPVGAGAFKLKSWEPGHRIVVERNPDYWRGDTTPLREITFRPLANEDSRQSALLAGDVDVIQTPSTRFSAQYGQDPKYHLMTGAGLGSVFLMMNTRQAPFDDVRVRRAIAHATNRPLFVKALLQDQYPLSDSLLGPGSWAYTPVPDYPEYAPDKARALLAEVGKPVSFEISVINAPFAVLFAQSLQQMWGEVGVKTTIRQTEAARYLADAINHQFQMSFFRFVGRADPDLNLYRAFHSRYADVPSSNYARYANPEMDAWLERGRATLDRDERRGIYAQVGELLARDVPYVFMFSTTLQTMMRADVDPGPNIADGVLRLHEARRR